MSEPLIIWGIIILLVVGIVAQQWQANPVKLCYYTAEYIYQTNVLDVKSILHMEENIRQLEIAGLEETYKNDLDYCKAKEGF